MKKLFVDKTIEIKAPPAKVWEALTRVLERRPDVPHRIGLEAR